MVVQFFVSWQQIKQYEELRSWKCAMSDDNPSLMFGKEQGQMDSLGSIKKPVCGILHISCVFLSQEWVLIHTGQQNPLQVFEA